MKKIVCCALLGSLFVAGNALGAFSGDSTGVFVNPVPSIGVTYTGVGSSAFTWGDASSFGTGPNSLTYANSPFSGIDAESTFKLGSLTYYNGTTALGSTPSTVDLKLSVFFSDPAGISQSFVYTMQLISTPNYGDPDGDADYVILSTFPSSTFTSGGNTYTLSLKFGNLTGGGFVQSGNQLHVREGYTATADLLGKITTDVSGVVPEPSTYLAGALLLLPFGMQVVRRVANRKS